MSLELFIRIAGCLQLALALLHVGFPRYFDWRTDLENLQPINREMMWVHMAFVAVTVFMLGLLSVTSADLLAGSALGHRISMGIFGFWTLRLVVQLFGYSSSLWRGKLFETAVHVLFTALWLFLASVYGLAAFS